MRAVAVFASFVFDAACGNQDYAMSHLEVLLVLADRGGEVAFESAGFDQFGLRENLDQWMPRDLGDRFGEILLGGGKWKRRRCSYGQEVSQVTQIAAQLLFPLDEMHRKALIGQRERSSHPGYPGAADQGGMVDRPLGGLQWLQLPGARYRHAYHRPGLGGCSFPVRGVHPRTLVADISHLEGMRVKPSLADSILEERFVGERCARSDHHAVQVQLFNLIDT